MLCIHCLKSLDKNSRSRDHVFPSSWYSDDTPADVQRWTVPSCIDCNNKFGRLEKDLFVRLAMCVDPRQFEASGITKKLMCSFGVGSNAENLSSQEEEKRRRLLNGILEKTFPCFKGIRVFPGFGPHVGFPLEIQRAIKIPENLLMPVLGKIYRGVEYKLGNKRYVIEPERLKIYHVDEEPKEVAALINKFSITASLGPGFKVFRVGHEEADVVLYKAIIWGKWTSYASLDLV